jgi:hypothetical protein
MNRSLEERTISQKEGLRSTRSLLESWQGGRGSHGAESVEFKMKTNLENEGQRDGLIA